MLRCRLHEADAEAPKKKAAVRPLAAASVGAARGKQPASRKRKARTDDGDDADDSDEEGELSEDEGEAPEWVEGFYKSVQLPVRPDPRGGLKVRLPAKPTALTFHELTCPTAVYETVLKYTLLNAKARDFDWEELRVFFAITMLMSVVKLTVLREYWERKWCGQETVKKHFTRPRFEAILASLHFSDADDRPEPMDEDTDRLDPADRNWKVEEVQKMFTNAWCRAGAYTQFLAHDESMILCKSGKEIRTQRMPVKPIRCGLKAFVLAGEPHIEAPALPCPRRAPSIPSACWLSRLRDSHSSCGSRALGPLRGYVYNVSIYGGAGDGNEDEAGAKANYAVCAGTVVRVCRTRRTAVRRVTKRVTWRGFDHRTRSRRRGRGGCVKGARKNATWCPGEVEVAARGIVTCGASACPRARRAAVHREFEDQTTPPRDTTVGEQSSSVTRPQGAEPTADQVVEHVVVVVGRVAGHVAETSHWAGFDLSARHGGTKNATSPKGRNP
eukprot:5585425-Prymnesium_polylepis.1